jgi:ubiquinone/menaquinone biosynthesis C-methylase UbiE
MNDENAIIIEAWNTILFDKFCRFRHILTAGLAGHSDELMRRHPPVKGVRVLDIGCGFGDTTRQIGERVGPTGRAIGVDGAANFIQTATAEVEQSGPPNTSFFVADVQTEDLRGPYDEAFSRFGTMFFNLPGAALRNIRRSLVPGGTLRMIVWRCREANPWLHEAELRVREIVPVVSHEETDQVHCGPGPFSMASPDVVSEMMLGAGFVSIVFERFDTDICIGRDLDEAVQFAMTLGPAGEIMRLAGAEGEKLQDEVVSVLRSILKPYQRDDGVWAASSTWFVSGKVSRSSNLGLES